MRTQATEVTEQARTQPHPVFGDGPYPRRRWLLISLSVLAGFALTVIWSAPFVDKVIGDNVANSILGYDAKETPITGVLMGTLFALVTGLAGTFTACNVAAFGALAPMAAGTERPRLRETLKPVGWLACGAVAVSAAYGVLVAAVGTSMPQFATVKTDSLSARNVQSMVVFGLIGVVFILMGLIAAGVIRNPFAEFTRRHPQTPLVVMGVLIGGFLIGRPYPLFRSMFRDAAERHDVLYGAAAFALQAVGNIAMMAVLFVLLVNGTRGRFPRWLMAEPGRVARITTAALIVAGVFMVLYWDLRVLGRHDLIWYPMIDWGG